MLPSCLATIEEAVTIFDYLVLLILVCSVIASIMRGLVKELLSLVGWIVSLAIANAYGPSLSELLPASIPGGAIRLIVGFAALFIVTKIVMSLVANAIGGLVQAAGMTAADRSLGGVFGFARGLIIVLTMVLVCEMTAIPRQAFWKNALLSPLAESAARSARPYLPGEFARHVQFGTGF